MRFSFRGLVALKKLIFPLALGILGTGFLIWLGIWQLERLNWKETVLAQIDARIYDAPVALPQKPSEDPDQFLPVTAIGSFTGQEIHVLASRKTHGAGYRVIAVLDIGTRRIMVDRGFIPTPAKNDLRPLKEVSITGNLHWPDELTSSIPEPDLGANIWFARDVAAMAVQLETEPTLLVSRSETGDGVEAFPVNSSGIPNDHLNYAITWFLFATVWFGMTLYLLWRIKRKTN